MIKRIILITFCLIPLAVFAEPTTQRGKPNRPTPQFKRPASRPAEDPQEFNNALGFLDKYSPNRFKAYESLDDDRNAPIAMSAIASALFAGVTIAALPPLGATGVLIVQ